MSDCPEDVKVELKDVVVEVIMARGVVTKLYNLGLQLGLPVTKLDMILVQDAYSFPVLNQYV